MLPGADLKTLLRETLMFAAFSTQAGLVSLGLIASILGALLLAMGMATVQIIQADQRVERATFRATELAKTA